MQPLDLLGIISRLAMLVDLVWGLKQAPRLNKMTMTKGVLALTFHRWQCLMSFAARPRNCDLINICTYLVCKTD